jgi:hypothetical protein
MIFPPFWPLNPNTASRLTKALVGFAPPPNSTPDDLTSAWRDSDMPDLLDHRGWAHTVTVKAGSAHSLQSAAESMWEKFRQTATQPDAMHRGAILIPDGTYHLDRELKLGSHPWFDLIGQSRDGTILTCGSEPPEATIYAKGTQSLIAHMTVERTGKYVDLRGPDMGIRYAIHDNTPGTLPRTVLFVDLDCKAGPSVSAQGVGTGFCAGGLHLYVRVNSDYGFFANNCDDIREAHESRKPLPTPREPGALIYLDCTSGQNEPRPACAIRCWNCGSGQKDILAVYGGLHVGEQYGLRVINFRSGPFDGKSETGVLYGKTILGGHAASLDVPSGTVVTDLDLGVSGVA